MLPTELTVCDREHELASIAALIRREVVTPYRLSAILEELGSAVGLVQQSESDRLFQPESPSHDLIGAVTREDLTKAIRDVRRWLGEGTYSERSIVRCCRR